MDTALDQTTGPCPVCETEAESLEGLNGFEMCEDCASEFPVEAAVDERSILALRRDLGLEEL